MGYRPRYMFVAVTVHNETVFLYDIGQEGGGGALGTRPLDNSELTRDG